MMYDLLAMKGRGINWISVEDITSVIVIRKRKQRGKSKAKKTETVTSKESSYCFNSKG